MTNDSLQFILKGVLRRALDKAGVGATDVQQEAVIDTIMADAAWQAKARSVWGPPGDMVSCDPAPNAARGFPAHGIGRTYKL